MRVLELARVHAGPFGGMLMSDLGAEVIKVEGLHGDDTRNINPQINGESVYFTSYNRGKESITLNLRTERGKQLFRELVKKVDVITENYRPGTLAKIGIDYPALRKINPRIIVASLTGYGQDGPYAPRPGFDMVVQAVGGMMDLTGFPGNPPVKVGVAIGDYIGGFYLAVGVLGALRRRDTTGDGEHIDVSLLDGMVSMLEYFVPIYLHTGKVLSHVGNTRVDSVPCDTYKAKDGYVQISGQRGVIFDRFMKAIGHPEVLVDPRFSDRKTRHLHREELDAIINEWVGSRTRAEVVETLSESEVACGPVQNIAEMVEDPQVKHREMFIQVDHSKAGKLWAPGVTLKMERAAKTKPGPPPMLGEHNEKIYGGLLGLSADEIAELKAQKVI
ncbi:MAG: CoA transferase [Chloroflexi bacterium]|nr:CoA transferase [Chloroflexota bacterium]